MLSQIRWISRSDYRILVPFVAAVHQEPGANLGFPPKPPNSGSRITLKSPPMIMSQSASIF